MPDNPKPPAQVTPPTVITLTLPHEAGLSKSGTLLIQRGDLARVFQFHYANTGDIASAIGDAREALDALAANPPAVPDLPDETPKSPARTTKPKAAPEPPPDEEPTIDIPLKKGTKAVKISHLKLVGGETDAAAYRQAVLIAGRLLDSRLWDGETPIRMDDVYAVTKKIKGLSDKEIGSLFTLEQFVQTGAAAAASVTPDEGDDAKDPAPVIPVSLNGHHPDDTTTLL